MSQIGTARSFEWASPIFTNLFIYPLTSPFTFYPSFCSAHLLLPPHKTPYESKRTHRQCVTPIRDMQTRNVLLPTQVALHRFALLCILLVSFPKSNLLPVHCVVLQRTACPNRIMQVSARVVSCIFSFRQCWRRPYLSRKVCAHTSVYEDLHRPNLQGHFKIPIRLLPGNPSECIPLPYSSALS